MNRLIGITGNMFSGKSTLLKSIKKENPKFIYIDVDNYRRKIINNKNYINDLKNKIEPLNKEKIINSIIINKYIYNNEQYMNDYKHILYKYLLEFINSFNNQIIIIEWALIIKDNLIDKFDKIIYLDPPENIILKRAVNSDLSKEDIKKRIDILKVNNIENYKNSNFLIVKDSILTDEIKSFLRFNSCMFTMPNKEAKAIWEITHSCNYGCSYCVFSCKKEKVNNELSTKECFHIIDELVLNGFKHLKITGGEPFLRNDILEILTYASKKMTVDISTNASFINENIVNTLNNLKLKMIHVSLDGNKKAQELVRGKNTYDMTTKGLKYLEKSNNKIRIGSVINKYNENCLESLVKEAVKYKTNEIIFSIMESIKGQKNDSLKTKNDEVLYEEINILKEKYKDKIIINTNFGKKEAKVNICPAAEKFIYINNMGFVSPCTWALEKNDKLLSSISLKNHTLKEVLSDKEIKNFIDNKKCGICYGKI